MTRVVVMLGAPGAGKGTQAVRISAAVSLPHISTGDLFRENLSQGTELGAQAREFMESGRLVPDDLVVDMLFARVALEDCAPGYLLDGFPRTISQAEVLDQRLPDGVALTVVDLEVSDEVIVERASGRLLCRACGNIQHIRFSPPAQAGVCDACGGELYQREDDRGQVVQERLAVYHSQTRPLVEFYRARGCYSSVDGSQAPDEVFSACMASLEVSA